MSEADYNKAALRELLPANYRTQAWTISSLFEYYDEPDWSTGAMAYNRGDRVAIVIEGERTAVEPFISAVMALVEELIAKPKPKRKRAKPKPKAKR